MIASPAVEGSLMAQMASLMLAELPPALGDVAARNRLLSTSAALPPIAQGGFECRLTAGDGRVDIQQCLPALSPERVTLRRHLEEHATDNPASAGLAALLSAWDDPDGPLGPSVNEVWLEYDVEPEQRPPCPSVFVGLRPGLLSRPRAQALAVLVQELLFATPSTALVRAMDQCLATCPDGGEIGHVGLMLGRPERGLRLNIKRLTPAAIPDYLEALGWSGPQACLTALLTLLTPLTDRVTLCLDFAPDLQPGLGLECVWVRQPSEDPRWEQLLVRLQELGLCGAEQAAGLLAWPGLTTPLNCRHPWPAGLIAASRLRPAMEFSQFERRLSHIKLGLRSDGELEAKGYLWYSHDWWRVLPPPPIADPLRPLELPYIEQVRSYYDGSTEAYLVNLGRTFQGWTVDTEEVADVTASNRYLAERAGLEAGMAVLDAGCGVCGPAIDIATTIPNLRIDAITLSQVQADHARRFVHEAGLECQISIHCGDFHHLPFPPHSFDAVVFLESSGNTVNRLALFADIHRVLRPGGLLYIKDAFVREGALSPVEERALAEFDRIFLYRTPTLTQLTKTLMTAGFDSPHSRDMTGLVSGDRWRRGLLEPGPSGWGPSALATMHQAEFEVWPVFCGEVIARKP